MRDADDDDLEDTNGDGIPETAEDRRQNRERRRLEEALALQEEWRAPDGQGGEPAAGYSTAWDRQQDARIDALDQYILTPGEVAANPGAQAESPEQRLRIHVPNVKTTLSMGARGPGNARRECDSGAPNFAGFGVHTEGHIFLTASKDQDTSTATLQAKGDIVVQSEQGLLWAGSKEQAMLASQANAMVMGGGGVVIAGGAAVTWAANPEPDDVQPQPPGWMSGFGEAGSAINRVWAGMDALVAIGMGVKGFINAKTARPKGLDLAIAGANLVLGNAGGTIVSGLGAFDSDPIGGTVIHGTGGVIVGSTLTMGLYSLTGTTIASLLGVSVVAPSVGVTGANDATLEAGRSVEVKSGGKAAFTGANQTIVASRRADLKLLGKEIDIGANAAEEGVTQGKTERLGMYGEYVDIKGKEVAVAGDTLALRADEGVAGLAAKTTASISGQHVTVIAETGIDMSASSVVRAGVGEFAMMVRDSKLWVGHAGERIPKKPSQPARHPKKSTRQRIRADYEERLADWKGNYVPGDSGVEFKKDKVEWRVGGNRFKMDRDKFKTGSLVWKK